MIKSCVRFGEREGHFFSFERKIGPFFFGITELAFRLVANFLSEFLLKLKLFGFAQDGLVAFDFEDQFAVFGIPDSRVSIGVSGGDPLGRLVERDGADGLFEFLEWNWGRSGIKGRELRKRGVDLDSCREMALPEFEGPVSSGGEDLVLIEGKGVDEIAVSGIGERRIDDFGIEISAMEVVDIESVSAGNSGEAGLWSDGGGVARSDLGERGPLSRAGKSGG